MIKSQTYIELLLDKYDHMVQLHGAVRWCSYHVVVFIQQ